MKAPPGHQQIGKLAAVRAYRTIDGFWVKAVPAAAIPPTAADRTGACYEARMLGAIEFQFLVGCITLGPQSLILFEQGRGGKIMSSAMIEILT